jgi:hypothetical protein
VGWRDTDGDSLPDVVDTQPTFAGLEPYNPDPTSAGRLEYEATAYDNPWPHGEDSGFYYDTTINTVASVDYRVDGDSWLPANPSDGSFDTDYEPFWFDTGALAAGTHLVEVRAINSVGNASDIWSDTVEIVDPSGPFGKTAPAGGSYASTSPTLSWETSSGATEYEYCADTTDNNHCDASWVSALTGNSTALSGLGNNVTYYWQVRSLSALGWTYADDGTWSSFTARNPTFADVPIDHSLWQYIEAFYASGITTGCGVSPLIYCPEQNVTRAAMAVFLLRAKYGGSYAPPPATHTFADLPVTGKEWQEAWVDQFYLEGITSGCGVSPLIYCPENPVTRAAMAVFILRALEGASYTPPTASHFFADLPVAGKEWMEPWVDEFYRRGITTGCGTGPLIFCPETAVKRQAMAAFIVRAFDLPLP